MHASGFKAARQKNVLSYLIDNIDTDATKNYIYDYMKRKRVTPTFINVYHGRNGAVAKVNTQMINPRLKTSYFGPAKSLYESGFAGKNGRKRDHTPADGRDNVTSIGDITLQRAAATTDARSTRHTTARTHFGKVGSSGLTTDMRIPATTTKGTTTAARKITWIMSGTLSPM